MTPDSPRAVVRSERRCGEALRHQHRTAAAPPAVDGPCRAGRPAGRRAPGRRSLSCRSSGQRRSFARRDDQRRDGGVGETRPLVDAGACRGSCASRRRPTIVGHLRVAEPSSGARPPQQERQQTPAGPGPSSRRERVELRRPCRALGVGGRSRVRRQQEKSGHPLRRPTDHAMATIAPRLRPPIANRRGERGRAATPPVRRGRASDQHGRGRDPRAAPASRPTAGASSSSPAEHQRLNRRAIGSALHGAGAETGHDVLLGDEREGDGGDREEHRRCAGLLQHRQGLAELGGDEHRHRRALTSVRIVAVRYSWKANKNTKIPAVRMPVPSAGASRAAAPGTASSRPSWPPRRGSSGSRRRSCAATRS